MNERNNRLQEIYNKTVFLLCRLGITANYDGFYQTVSAVLLAAEDPVLLQSATGCIYPEVASKYGTSSENVRKNIDKVCCLAWERNPELLSETAMYQIKKKPGTCEFLAILSVYVICTH